MPYETEKSKRFGLILLVPEKDNNHNDMCLVSFGIEVADSDEDIPGIVEQLKQQTDWNRYIFL